MNTATIAFDIFETALGWIAIETSDHGVVRTTLPEPHPSHLMIKGESQSSPFSPNEKGELKGVQSGYAVNSLRLATLDASPFCCEKRGGTANSSLLPLKEESNPFPFSPSEKGDSSSDAQTILEATKDRLIRYCDGEDVGFDNIPTQHTSLPFLKGLKGKSQRAGAPFTARARAACRTIPRGETRTYAWLAEQASGSRKTARAAARAMATNPLPLIIPCHRVIGSDGKLHGFGGTIGIPLKAKLLEMEGFELGCEGY